MSLKRRDVFLKIEPLKDYSPLAPVTCARHYGRDCMFNVGHELGRIPPSEILAASLDALVYREYLDPDFKIPNKAKIIQADVNEPPWNRRVPGAVLYAKPDERLYIHVLNDDSDDCHSFHLHGLKYGIDSDGAWPFGVASRNGRRSDEILPGQRWTYVFDATPETVGGWVFHDHVRNVQRNVNRGLFGGLIVRDPAAPCPDHEVPLFVHVMAGASKEGQFQSPTLSPGGKYSFTFGTTPGTCRYHCLIHGTSMSGQVIVATGASMKEEVKMHDMMFDPSQVTIGPGGEVTWINKDRADHIVFASGGGASNFCLNGRSYVGNTPTIVADSGERLRWHLFNMDLGDVWHNFHPHSARWQLPVPPGGAADVHGLSPSQSFVIDTEVPPAVRLPCELEELQCEAPENACRVRLKGDFLVHCHLEEHMMQGLAGLVRARQWVWVTEGVLEKLSIELPYDDGQNDCPHVDLKRCPTVNPPAPAGTPMGSGGGMGSMGSSPMDLSKAATHGVWELLPCDSQILAVHAALLHTGKVLFFAGSGNYDKRLDKRISLSVVWDYERGTFHQPSPTPFDIFCAGQSFLPNGCLLVAGGNITAPRQPFLGRRDANILDPISERWVRTDMMAGGRWYPSLIALGDGRVFTISGLRDTPDAKNNSQLNRVPEIYSSATGWTALKEGPQWPLFPHLFLMRDGKLFFSGGYVFGFGFNPATDVPGPIRLDPATNKFVGPPIPLPASLGFELLSRDQSVFCFHPRRNSKS